MSKRCCAGSCFNSQQINKNVSYFGFPKYEEFAVKWAIAAGRSDLLEKKLTSITKYFLCSEHFAEDSFFDPPNNTRLKKSLNPVNIPIPSIFKCNITKYMPQPKAAASSEFTETDDDDADDVEDHKKMSALGRIREALPLESLSVFHDHYNYTDITNCASSFLNNVPDIPPNIDGNVDLGADTTFADDISFVEVNSFHICRLCAATFASSENIVEISSDVFDRLNDLITNTMHINNSLPMIACTSCLDRLNTCLSSLEFFKRGQSNLRRIYPSS